MERKTVLITGAKGGLGSALIHKFRNKGWFVVATDLEEMMPKEDNPDKMVLEIAMDVSSPDSVHSVANLLKAGGRKLGLIINNAGIDGYFPLSETPEERFTKMFEVNVFGSYRVNQSFFPLLNKPGGRIIHIGSEAAKINVPFMTYPITKQTLEGYSKTLRQELRFLGIDVTLIRPGAIDTPFLDHVRRMKNPVPDSLLNSPFEKFAERAPGEIGRKISPSKAADLIYRIATVKRTRPVYQINNDMRLSLASLMPFSLVERMVYRRLR